MQSIRHEDDSEKYLLDRTPMLSGYVWRERKIGVAQGKVERYTEKYAEEVERTKARNTWIRQLRESPGGAIVTAHIEARRRRPDWAGAGLGSG